jgi:hypothetical protein
MEMPVIRRDSAGTPISVSVSALVGQGLDAMLNCIDELLAGELVQTVVTLNPEQGMIRAPSVSRWGRLLEKLHTILV